MATDVHFIFSDAAASAEDVGLKATWIENAITVFFTAIAVIIVSATYVYMVLAERAW